MTAAAGVALYVNDRIDVALAVGADGVHLGGTSLDVATAALSLLEVDAHGFDDIDRRANVHQLVDVGFGQINGRHKALRWTRLSVLFYRALLPVVDGERGSNREIPPNQVERHNKFPLSGGIELPAFPI
jgi:hypothetical protein